MNPDLSPRPLRLLSPDALPGGQAVEGGSLVATGDTVAGLTAAVVVDPKPAPGLSVGDRRLENALVRVEIDPTGALASVFDKRAGREALAGRGNQIWAYVDKPRNWDAWDLEDNYADQGEEIDRLRDRGGRDGAAPGGDPGDAQLPRQQRSRRPTGSGPTRRGSTSRPTSTGTSARYLLKARFPLAVRAGLRRPSSARTG